MKRIGWAIALAAAFLTPAAAQEPATNTAAPGNAMVADPSGTGGPAQVASAVAGNPTVAQPVSETGVNTLPAGPTTAPFTYAAPVQ
ncbi:MAG: hypothetical protein M3428_05825, partial [Pseudomonadota bacterium]|nr:hypothetical protein [Pseudomonadota bacterium]